jgi:glycosyltransferase involved in cell wall biosynthesis
MEAMAAGLPVVSTLTGSIDELVTPETGRLVPQRDPIALADALEPLLRDHDLRRAVGGRAREHVRANFSTEATTALLRAHIDGTASANVRFRPLPDVANREGTSSPSPA